MSHGLADKLSVSAPPEHRIQCGFSPVGGVVGSQALRRRLPDHHRVVRRTSARDVRIDQGAVRADARYPTNPVPKSNEIQQAALDANLDPEYAAAGWGNYGLSKAANVLFTVEMQARRSRDAAERQPRGSRGAAEMQPRCSREAY